MGYTEDKIGTNRTFQGLHFKVTIPEIVEFPNRLELHYSFIYTQTGVKIDTLLEKCEIKDRLNHLQASFTEHILFTQGKREKAVINFEQGNKKIFLADSKIEFTYLCSNKKRVIISYMVDYSHNLMLKEISSYGIADIAYSKMLAIMNGLNNTSRKAEKDEEDTEVYSATVIQEYSDALRHEILFLKQGKGKKYKIVNGVKINMDKGIFTYLFELETELHLPDDAPVVVDTTNGIHAVGTVLTCEDFQIILLVDSDMGESVFAAYLMVEPWKLLEALNEHITSLKPNINRLAIKLIEEGPRLATNRELEKIPKGQEEVFNQLKHNDIVAVWGPPGTGKTYTMSQIAINYLRQGKTILIVSHSNVSVDGVIKKVVDMAGQEMKSYLTRGWILRCGYVRDDELAKHPYATSFNYTLSKCPEYASELEELTKKRETLRAKKQTRTAAYDETEKRIKKVREQIRKEERQYVKNARLLGTTISKVTIDSSFDKRRFDVVMFDEVSMAYVPQIITAAALASEKFVCVGDFRQLPPISQSPASKLLQNDIFSYLKIVDAMGEIYWHPWLVMLNEQRRMHPDISKFPNKFIYKNLLKNHPSVEHCHDEIIKSDPLSGEALNLIDLAGSYCAADKNTDGSRFNILSAVVSFSTAVSAEKNEGTSVGIIAPYAAQARLIRAMIRDYYEHGTTTVSCATVHQFQGSESDVLIFDAVESYPKSAVGFLMGKDLNQVSRLINVAITRARGKLITVANARFWENVFKGTNHIFYKLLGHIQNGHRVISQKDKTLQPYIDSINPNRMIRIFTDESEAINALKKDMAKASGIVLVSIPDGELKESAKMILDLLLAAERKGVEILMKSNDYTNLPVTWKRYCWETENAVFPLIVIDDEIVWYGLPTSRMKFKADKTTSYITVMHAMVRIKGKNTVEMIKALTDIEMIEEGINKKQISVKKESLQVAKKDRSNKQEHSIAISQGLAAFIEKKEVCTECGSHMVLSKNQRGTAYLRCSNRACKHMEYLTPELMNEYISSNHVGCPRHDGGIIKGLLGKYGPCIRCSSGHFMKPEEI